MILPYLEGRNGNNDRSSICGKVNNHWGKIPGQKNYFVGVRSRDKIDSLSLLQRTKNYPTNIVMKENKIVLWYNIHISPYIIILLLFYCLFKQMSNRKSIAMKIQLGLSSDTVLETALKKTLKADKNKRIQKWKHNEPSVSIALSTQQDFC